MKTDSTEASPRSGSRLPLIDSVAAKEWLNNAFSDIDFHSSSAEHADAIVVMVDAMELLELDPHFAGHLLADPHAVAFRISTSADIFQGKRLWFRLFNLPFPSVSAHQLWQTAPSKHPGRALVHVHGVVYATTALHTVAYMRRFCCSSCGNVTDVFVLDADPDQGFESFVCCALSCFQEDKSQSIYVHSQEVILGPILNVLSKESPLPQLISVVMYDDLTGRVHLGDSVTVIGHAVAEIGNASGYQRCIAHHKVIANSVDMMNPEPKDGEESSILLHLDDYGNISLDALCESVFPDTRWSGLALNRHAKIALLLSLTACKNAQKFEDLSDNNKRQIHVLLACNGAAEILNKQLRSIAGEFSDRSVQHNASAKSLACRITRDANGRPEKLHAGSLCLSNDGIFLIDFMTSPLSKSEVGAVSEAMSKASSSVRLKKSEQEITIPWRSTIWGCYGYEMDVKKKLNEFSRPFLHSVDASVAERFDIMVYIEEELDFLMAILAGGMDQSSRISALKEHLEMASDIASVNLSTKAQRLIMGYYMAVRKEKTSFHYKSDGILFLQSLLRMASACARLCLREQVLEMPDAALAILLSEQTLKLKKGMSFVASGTIHLDNLDDEIRDFHQHLLHKVTM